VASFSETLPPHLQLTTTTMMKKSRDCPLVQEKFSAVSSSFDSRRLFPGPKRYQCSVSVTSGTPLPSPQSDATTIMIAILDLIVVVMIASVITNMHACSSARGDIWPANLSMRLLREPRKLFLRLTTTNMNCRGAELQIQNVNVLPRLFSN